MSEPKAQGKSRDDYESGSAPDIEVEEDAVFGRVGEIGGPNYRNVGWLGTVALMMKTQVGLGVLAIPASFAQLGLIPGVILLCTIAVLTGWASHIIGSFKLRHRDVYGLDDAARLMFGPIGYQVMGVVFCVYWIFVAGSGMLGISIGLNAVSSHATCTCAFVATAAVFAFGFGSIRTLGKLSWLAWAGLLSIMCSILTLTIAVGVAGQPADAPPNVPWQTDFKLFGKPTFAEGVSAVSGYVFAYGGVPAYFSIVSEMRNPRHYTRALVVSQVSITVIYIAIGCVVYYYCGSYVASPALGSAGGTLKKVCYALALPGLLVSTTIFVHVPAKYILIRLLRGSKHLVANTMVHWATWLGCTFGISVMAYIVASAIPFFGLLTSLVGALFGCIMSFQFMGMMWFHDNWLKRPDFYRWGARVLWAGFVVIAGTVLMVSGTYGSVLGIIGYYNKGSVSAAWSCADNSNSS